MTAWTEPGWRAAADAWLRGQAELLGLAPVSSIEQPHVRRWGTVLRAETAGGVVWLKAPAEELLYELGLTELLAARAPGLAPRLLASDREHGWLLLADAGERLRELVAGERSLARWLDVLPLYAELQLALAGDADELLALGVPDLRLDVLPDRLEALLRRLDAPEAARALEHLPRVRGLASELAAFGLPATVQHDDLHDGQVFVDDGAYRVLDWGDACVSHPFFSLSVTLEGQIAWGVDDVEGSEELGPYRDAYLRAWRAAYPDAELEAAVELALPLGWACRVANGHVEGEDAATLARLGMLLAGLERLGA
ncbi:MAG TPA: aminoglycoside phosphotransferase family protein [Gaiellaceae bacterium]|nr:aminoglycoside phosphotransferase family protein [Gaiellaceae bacterium]